MSLVCNDYRGVCSGQKVKCMEDKLNKIGQFDHIWQDGKLVKCRSSCQDQTISLYTTSSRYPNRNTFVYREEFCIVAKRLVEKCKSSNRKSLERMYPNICSQLDVIDVLEAR